VSPNVKPEAFDPQPLPRGRHRLSRDAVRASQRERLVQAMVELVGRQGYEATTVPQVVAAARVSRNAFYEFFADKTDCFLAVCDELTRELLVDLVALAAETDWLTALRRGMRIYLHWWQERPVFTRAYFLELPIAGARAIEQRDRAYEQFRAMFRDLGARARAEQPRLGPLEDVAVSAAVFAPTELVAERVRAGRLDDLLELEDELVYLLVKLLADEATAARAVGRGTRSRISRPA
jgi:AcrR family transcriptional regulator